MGTLATEPDERVSRRQLRCRPARSCDLMDGRTIAVPIAWYPRLERATPQQRSHWEIAGAGYGIHWSDIDEDLSVEGLSAAPRRACRLSLPSSPPKPISAAGSRPITKPRRSCSSASGKRAAASGRSTGRRRGRKHVKRWSRAWKYDLIHKDNPSWRDLAEDFGFEPLVLGQPPQRTRVPAQGRDEVMVITVTGPLQLWAGENGSWHMFVIPEAQSDQIRAHCLMSMRGFKSSRVEATIDDVRQAHDRQSPGARRCFRCEAADISFR